jgi:hypothetical protein
MKLIDILKITEPATWINLHDKNLNRIAVYQAQDMLTSSYCADKLNCRVIGINPGDKLNTGVGIITEPFLFITINV